MSSRSKGHTHAQQDVKKRHCHPECKRAGLPYYTCIMSSPVKDFYKNKNVLLTGGTGYFGKMIVEKLLRATEVRKIYLIGRSKEDVDFEKRVIKMFQEPIFSDISESLFLNKVHPLEGDLQKKYLGLTNDNIAYLQNHINVVFHCGASLNMDAYLEDAVTTNVNGTAELLGIVKGAPSLEAFVLVSTAFSNCLHRVIEEAFYDPPIDPKLLIRIVDEMSPELLISISKGIIGKWPNTYAFTKAVAEHLLVSDGKHMPVALFRPTIVTSTVSEPMAGWSDNLYGPLGILLSSGCGILRVVRGNPKIKADTVPGDLVINGLLCYAWEVATQWKCNRSTYRPRVMNFSGRDSSLYVSIRQYTSTAANSGYTPFRKTVWKPILYIFENKWLYMGTKFLIHSVPAYLLDLLLRLVGRKPQMRKLYFKIDKVIAVLHYFLVREWTIKNDNMKYLWKKLTPNDRRDFNFDFKDVKLEPYLRDVMIGLKKYTLKEDMSKADYHKARYQHLVILHNTLKYVCVFLIAFPCIRLYLYRFLSLFQRYYSS